MCSNQNSDYKKSIIINDKKTIVTLQNKKDKESFFEENYIEDNSYHNKNKKELFPLRSFKINLTESLKPSQIKTGMSSMLSNNVMSHGLLPPLDHYRLQLYNYAMVERFRCSQYHSSVTQNSSINTNNTISFNNNSSGDGNCQPNRSYEPRFALSMSLFHNRVFQPEEPKPQHSYIGLIAMAIISSPESKLVLSDIYQHILDNYPYFRTRGPGWRNSIRHNLSLNDCFVKAGRSANGKGHYWAIHPANKDDFKKGDFRRRKAQRKVRKHMGLAVDDEGTDSPSPPPLTITPPGLSSAVAAAAHVAAQGLIGSTICSQSWANAAAVAAASSTLLSSPLSTATSTSIYSSRKRQFDVASLLAPDDDNRDLHSNHNSFIRNFHLHHHAYNHNRQQPFQYIHFQQHNGQQYKNHNLVANNIPEEDNLNQHQSRNESTAKTFDPDVLFHNQNRNFNVTRSSTAIRNNQLFSKRIALNSSSDVDEYIDVVASDEELPITDGCHDYDEDANTIENNNSLKTTEEKYDQRITKVRNDSYKPEYHYNLEAKHTRIDDQHQSNYETPKKMYHSNQKDLRNSADCDESVEIESTESTDIESNNTINLSSSHNLKTSAINQVNENRPEIYDQQISLLNIKSISSSVSIGIQEQAKEQQQKNQLHQKLNSEKDIISKRNIYHQHQRNVLAAAAGWQDIIQHMPNNIQSLSVAAAASCIDPRILGRYYEQYMAAAHQVTDTHQTNTNNRIKDLLSNENNNNNDRKSNSNAIINNNKDDISRTLLENNLNNHNLQEEELELNIWTNDCS